MPDAPKEREQSTQERAYAVICLVSLLLVVVLMMLDGIGVMSVLPMLVGGVAFLLRWRSGPPLVLFVFLWMAPTRYHHGAEADEAPAAPPLRRRRRRPWGSRRLCFQTPGDEPGEPRNMFEDTRDWGIGQGDGVP